MRLKDAAQAVLSARHAADAHAVCFCGEPKASHSGTHLFVPMENPDDKLLLAAESLLRMVTSGLQEQMYPLCLSAEEVQSILEGRRKMLWRLPFRGKKHCPWKWDQGAKLWVQETWSVDPMKGDGLILYRASWTPKQGAHPKWRSSTSMPRNASRITLLVTGCVNFKPVQEITLEEAQAFGIVASNIGGELNALGLFHKQWEAQFTEPGTRWEDNPWIYTAPITQI
jgi:hypothetical protein